MYLPALSAVLASSTELPPWLLGLATGRMHRFVRISTRSEHRHCTYTHYASREAYLNICKSQHTTNAKYNTRYIKYSIHPTSAYALLDVVNSLLDPWEWKLANACCGHCQFHSSSF